MLNKDLANESPNHLATTQSTMPRKKIAVIGAGPAGLRAAEVAAEGGAQVSLFDAKPSSGRKFLVAGKRGLNLTHDENWNDFLLNYSGTNLPLPLWTEILNAFDNQALRKWSSSLGIETFAASSGKVFPVEMKAAALLKRWINKLRDQLEVSFSFNHQFTNFRCSGSKVEVSFLTPEGCVEHTFDTIVLAFGGGSWASTGSTGEWVNVFKNLGIGITPLSASNCGWEINWANDFITNAEGLPLKNIAVAAGDQQAVGELVITKYGLEGGPIYKLGPAIKALPSPEIMIDFKPNHSIDQLISKMESAKKNLINEAKLRWKLNPGCHALLDHHFNHSKQLTTELLAKTVKNFRIPLACSRPIDEAISSAGGVNWSELDGNLMLKKFPRIFCAGEMLDWEAPTGGYLLQACFATGDWAGKASLQES